MSITYKTPKDFTSSKTKAEIVLKRCTNRTENKYLSWKDQYGIEGYDIIYVTRRMYFEDWNMSFYVPQEFHFLKSIHIPDSTFNISFTYTQKVIKVDKSNSQNWKPTHPLSLQNVMKLNISIFEKEKSVKNTSYVDICLIRLTNPFVQEMVKYVFFKCNIDNERALVTHPIKKSAVIQSQL